MPGRKFESDKYRYGFNGKENDKNISDGAQDYGMRISDARLGRFLSVDPITKDYPELTPYQFASNTPIQAIDLDGLEAATLTYQARVTAVLVTGSVSIGVAIDIKGNFHLFYQWSAGIGAGLYGGAGLTASFFPTASADNLMGSGFNAGGSLGLGGVSVSLDLSTSVSTDETGKLNGAKLGISGGGKLGPSLGAELHIDYSSSTSVAKGNLFSMKRSKLVEAIREKVDDSWFLSMSDEEINNFVDYIAKTYKTLKEVNDALNPPKPATSTSTEKKKEQPTVRQKNSKKPPQSTNSVPKEKATVTSSEKKEEKKESTVSEKKLKAF